MATAVGRIAARGTTRSPKQQPQAVNTIQDEAEADYERLVHVWHPGDRPGGAQPTEDANFTLEDEGFTSFCHELLSGSWCVGDQCQPGSPIMAVSSGFESLTGYTAAELLGKGSIQALQGSKTDPEAVTRLSAAVASQAMSMVELTIHKKSGRPLSIRVSVVAMCGSSNEPWLSLQFARNLSEQRKKEPSQPQQQQQQQQQQQAEQAAAVSKWMEQVQQCIGALHLESNHSSLVATISSCSSQLAVMTGYSQTELCNSSILALMGPDTSSSTTRHFLAAQLAGRPAVAKLLLYRKDGSPFWAMVASCPVGSQAAAASSADSAQPPPQQQQQQLQQHLMIVINTTASRPRKIGKYLLGRVLGQGASGVVRIGKNTATDELVAIKAVDATRFRSITEIEQVQEEMAVLATLKHPNIIRLLEVHFVNSCFYFVMEYASGGSMVRYIYSQEGGRLSESQARQLFGQILSALEYCHKRRVIHRDLKPENILMEGDSPKVADFGLAGVMNTFGGGGFTLQCGTPEFTAPEIVEGKEYEGPAVDLWSVGVMLYEALSGHLPFKGSSQSSLFKTIQRGVYQPLPQSISLEARDLVKKLLTVDPAARISWYELSRHPWINSSNSSSSGCSSGRSSLTNIGQQIGALSLGSTAGSSSSGLSRLKMNSVPTAVLVSLCAAADDGIGSRREGLRSAGCSADYSRYASDSGDSSIGSETSRGSCRQEEVSDAEAGDADAAAWAAEGTTTMCAGLSGSPAVGSALGRTSSVDVIGSRRLAASFTSGSCHESVRVIIPDNSRDDPITAAIKQRLTGGGDSSGVCSESSSDHCSPSNRAYSFSGVVSPATPGGTRLAQTSKTGLALGRTSQVTPQGGASSRQSGASGSLPPLSPSGGANTLNSSSGRSRRSIFASTTNSSGSSSGPASSRARGISTSSPMRERRKSSLITSRAQGYADMGDSIGSLPPISRDRGINRQHI